MKWKELVNGARTAVVYQNIFLLYWYVLAFYRPNKSNVCPNDVNEKYRGKDNEEHVLQNIEVGFHTSKYNIKQLQFHS